MKIYKPFNFDLDFIFLKYNKSRRHKNINIWKLFKEEQEVHSLYKNIIPCNNSVNFSIEEDDALSTREDAIEDVSILKYSSIHKVIIGHGLMLDTAYNILILFTFTDNIPTIFVSTKLFNSTKLLKTSVDNIINNMNKSIFKDIRIVVINKEIKYLKELEITTNKPYKIAERVTTFLATEKAKTNLKLLLWEE